MPPLTGPSEEGRFRRIRLFLAPGGPICWDEVQVTGQFASLTSAVDARLRTEQPDHDVFASAFTAQGTFTYAPSLTRLTLRYLLEVSEESAVAADEAAVVEGELLAAQFLESRGITHKPWSVSAVCLQDVKVRRARVAAQTHTGPVP